MSMIEIGQKEKELYGSPVATKSSGDKMVYPSFSVSKEIPIDEKSIGKEITATVKLRVRSISKRSDKSGNNYTCSFDVLGIDLNQKKQSGHYNK